MESKIMLLMIFDMTNISTCNIKNDKLKVLGRTYNPRGASFLSLSPIYLLMNIFNLFFVCLKFVYSFVCLLLCMFEQLMYR